MSTHVRSHVTSHVPTRLARPLAGPLQLSLNDRLQLALALCCALTGTPWGFTMTKTAGSPCRGNPKSSRAAVIRDSRVVAASWRHSISASIKSLPWRLSAGAQPLCASR